MAKQTVDLVVTVREAADVKAEALREAADLLYTDDGPGNMLSTADWLRSRADSIQQNRHAIPWRTFKS